MTKSLPGSSSRSYVLGSMLRLVLLAVVLTEITFLATRYALRVDLTADQLYTLTSSTKTVLESLEDRLVIEAYFSPDDSLPVTYRQRRVMMRNTLQEFVELGDGKVSVQYFNPYEDRTVRETAERLGVKPQPLRTSSTGQLTATEIWQGMRIRYGAEKQEVLSVIPFGSTYNYEAILTPLIKRLTVKEKPMVGVLAFPSQPGAGGMTIQMEKRTKPQKFVEVMRALSREYEFRPIDVRKGQLIPPEIKVALLIRPKLMTDRMMFIFDQFLMRGGKLVVFADSVEVEVRPDREFRGKVPKFEHATAKMSFLDMLRNYGVAVEQRIVAEGRPELYQRYGVPTQERFFRFHYPYMFQPTNYDWKKAAGDFAKDNSALQAQYELLFKPGINKDHELMSAIADSAIPGLFWPCPVGLADPMPAGVAGEVLMRTSPYSWKDLSNIELDPFVGSRDTRQRLDNMRRWETGKARMIPVTNPTQIPLMVHVKGTFASAFKDRAIPPREFKKAESGKDPDDWGDEPEKQGEGPQPKKPEKDTEPKETKLVQSQAGASLLVIGDATFIRDDFIRADYAQAHPTNEVVGPSGHHYGRVAMVFFRNILDWMLQERDLRALINKKGVDRMMVFEKQTSAETGEEFQKRLRSEVFWVRWTNALGPALLFALLGIILWMVRSARKRAFLAQFRTYQPSTRS